MKKVLPILIKAGCRLKWLPLFSFVLLNLIGCAASPLELQPLPTVASVAVAPTTTIISPPTYTPLPLTTTNNTSLAVSAANPILNTDATGTPVFIPTNTPIPPTATPTATPTETPAVYPTSTPVIKPIDQYSYSEVIPYQAFPVPYNNNGWGVHWIPTTSQEHGVIDRFVGEAVKMNIKWVVFLNGGADMGANDYLVERLVANGIMPVMRLYQSNISPYGDLVPVVRHYRAKGVYYYQIYNEPNVNIENTQGSANPHHYAVAWAAAARQIISAGGLPGIGAFSPGGEYNHYEFLDRTLRALDYNGDINLLNHAWLSVHNYHGVRALDDPDGFLLFRKYDEIIRTHLGRSLPVVGTEGGSYSQDINVETALIRWQYNYVRSPDTEPYFLAFSYWLLANREGGGFDNTWEWQTWFKPGFVHPAVSEYFYRNGY